MMSSDFGSLFSSDKELPSKKKDLLIHETVIAKKVTKDENNKYQELTIMYGNFILPVVNGKYLTLKEDKYRKQLDDFLKSEEGKNYIYPTEEEIKKASKETDKYRQKLEKELIEKNKSEEIKKEETKKEDIILPINIQATKDEIYLKALKTPEEESKIKVEELEEKVKEIKEERKSEKRIRELETQLEKERSAREKERKKNIQQLAKASQTKDELIDNFLFKTLSVCLIISVCMCFILIYLYLMK